MFNCNNSKLWSYLIKYFVNKQTLLILTQLVSYDYNSFTFFSSIPFQQEFLECCQLYFRGIKQNIIPYNVPWDKLPKLAAIENYITKEYKYQSEK